MNPWMLAAFAALPLGVLIGAAFERHMWLSDGRWDNQPAPPQPPAPHPAFVHVIADEDRRNEEDRATITMTSRFKWTRKIRDAQA